MKANKLVVLTALLGIFSINLGKVLAADPAVPKGFGVWQPASVGDNMTLRIPGKFKVTSLDLDKETQKKIDLMETYTLDNANPDDYACLVSYIIYNKGIMANLEGAGTGAMDNMKNQPGVTGFTFKQKAITRSGLEGSSLTGSYKSDGKTAMFQTLIFVKRNVLWMVITIDITKNKMPLVTKAINDSLQFKF